MKTMEPLENISTKNLTSSLRGRHIFEKHPKLTIAVTLIIIIVAMDIFASHLYKRIYGYYFYQNSENDIERAYRIPSDIYHHDLKKNVLIRSAIWGSIRYSVSTDSLGFKSRHVKETSLSSPYHRIMFIGDSFTEGTGMEYQNTFVGIIDEKLSKENIEVLNAAVSSYSPIIYWRKIKYLIEERGLKFNELIVFLDISDILDEAVSYRLSKDNTVEDTNPMRRIVMNNTIIAYSFLDGMRDFINRGIREGAINRKRSMWTVNDDYFHEYGKEGLNKAAYYMVLLHELLKKNGIKLTLAVYPWPDQIVNNNLNSIQVTFWKDWAQTRDVDKFLNYFPRFVKLGNNEMAHRETLERFFIPGDVHWNENGHKIVADTFLSFFRSQCKICERL